MHLSLVTRRNGTEVLLEVTDGARALPAHEASMPTEIRAELSERHGLSTVYLGPLAQFADGVRVHVLEADGPGDGTRQSQWADAAAVSALPFAEDQPKDLVVALLRGEAPLPAVPWTEPGWFAAATAWAAEELERNGTPLSGPAEQLIVSPWACTLRLPVGDTHAFVKGAPAPFAYEPELTRRLHELFPENTIPVVATRPEDRWMLSMDIGEARVVEEELTNEHLPIYRRALERYAAMQQRLIAEADSLRAIGVPDRSPATLPDLYDEIVDDTYWLAVGEEGGIDEDTHRKLRAYAPRFRKDCDELAAVELPDTLVNVDWWHGNLSFRDSGDVMFDWAESVVGSPLYSLTTILRIAETGGMPEDFKDALVDAYLAAWSAYGTPQELRRWYELALPGSFLVRVQTWRQCVMLHAEPERYHRDRGIVAGNMLRLLPLLG
ncbi:hypothetical protein [Streptomyces tendae]|uniref:hypothetical protein n=1 Tax=Streptomyces tendae TaxID=1932 RepID=UPI0024902214|nr:hypothetical protein [Streptomyces tendae]